jgi:glycosyltransferase involved in cell wall biosynthesis
MTGSRRIVIASEFWFGATAEGLAHGFRGLGWDVCPVDIRSHFLGSRTFALRVVSRALRQASAASYNSAVLEAVRTLEPLAVLTVKGAYLTPATLSEIRSYGVATANYYPDFHFDHPGVDQATFPLYDRFITTKSFQLPFLRSRLDPGRVAFLHHGYSSLVYRPRLDRVREEDYIADVLYVGNHTPYKERWLSAVARGLPRVKLMIVGNGWGRAAVETGLKGSYLGHPLDGDSHARVLQQARICLALHAGPSGANGWQDLVSTRTFEIPACKGFMLHIDNEEVRSLFEPGTEIDVFETSEVLCEKIRYYLARPALRRDMIERAYARCVPAYSYDSRAEVISSLIDEVASIAKPTAVRIERHSEMGGSHSRQGTFPTTP